MQIGAALVLLLACLTGPAQAADMTSPDVLRTKHAGTATFDSPQALDELFPRVLEAADKCYAGKTDPAQWGIYGAVGSQTGASRIVEGRLSEKGDSAYVQVRAKSAFGLAESAFLQMDLNAKEGGGTRIVVYHKNNVKLQREFMASAGEWVAGNLNACPADSFVHKNKES